MTHPHLDHFNGAALIRHVFPRAAFYPQRGVLEIFANMMQTRQAGLGASASGGAYNLPTEAPDFFTPQDILAAADFSRNSGRLRTGTTVHAVGICMDGAYALRAARLSESIDRFIGISRFYFDPVSLEEKSDDRDMRVRRGEQACRNIGPLAKWTTSRSSTPRGKILFCPTRLGSGIAFGKAGAVHS